MKAKKVSKLLGLTIVLVGIVLSGCGKTEEAIYYDEVEVEVEVEVEEEVIEEVVEETVYEAEVSLNTDFKGVFYIVNEDSKVFNEPNQSLGYLPDLLPIDTEVTVSGSVDSGSDVFTLAQIVDENEEVIGYVEIQNLDKVKGGFQDAEYYADLSDEELEDIMSDLYYTAEESTESAESSSSSTSSSSSESASNSTSSSESASSSTSSSESASSSTSSSESASSSTSSSTDTGRGGSVSDATFDAALAAALAVSTQAQEGSGPVSSGIATDPGNMQTNVTFN